MTFVWLCLKYHLKFLCVHFRAEFCRAFQITIFHSIMPLRFEIYGTSLNYKTICEIHFWEKNPSISPQTCLLLFIFEAFLHISRDIEQQSPRPPWYSVLVFQGTNVARVLPQHFQKKNLSTSLSKFNVDLNYGYAHLQGKKNQKQSFEGVSAHLSLCPIFKDTHYSHIRVVWCLPERKGDRKVGGMGNQTPVLLVQSHLAQSLDWIFQEWTSNSSSQGSSGELYFFLSVLHLWVYSLNFWLVCSYSTTKRTKDSNIFISFTLLCIIWPKLPILQRAWAHTDSEQEQTLHEGCLPYHTE